MEFSLPLMLVAQAAEGAHKVGFDSPFEVNFGMFFWTWIIFIALFLALRKWAWPEILKFTEERERKLAHQLAEAERMNAEARQALEEHQRLVARAKEDAQALIAEAKSVAEREREQLLTRTREEQAQLLERAKREIQAERERAVAELRREAVDLSLSAASRLIGERLDSDANRRLVTEYLASLAERH